MCIIHVVLPCIMYVMFPCTLHGVRHASYQTCVRVNMHHVCHAPMSLLWYMLRARHVSVFSDTIHASCVSSMSCYHASCTLHGVVLRIASSVIHVIALVHASCVSCVRIQSRQMKAVPLTSMARYLCRLSPEVD